MFIKWFLKHCTDMYKTYNKASEVFVEPTLHFFHGSWRDYPGLPVWRRGNIITIGKYCQRHEKDKNNWSVEQVWDEKFLESCSWFGRLWRKFIKPVYVLPTWLSFYIFNEDAWIKSKWDYYSYEFPPQFCIVFFGRCIAWTLVAPSATSDTMWKGKNKTYPDNTAYWESIAEYLRTPNSTDSVEERLKEVLETFYHRSVCTPDEIQRRKKLDEKIKKLNTEDDNFLIERDKLSKLRMRLIHNIARLRCRPEYIKDKYLDFYTSVFDEMRSKQENKNYIWVY